MAEPARGAVRVSVVVPAFEEEADIARAVEAVRAQDLPADRIELIVVDGGSGDTTKEVVRRAAEGAALARVVVLDSPVRATPACLNLGLAAARGDVVCRVDARSIPQRHHVRRCVEVLDRDPAVVVVGGSQVARPRDGSPRAVGISRALNNRWGMGLARYRRGAASGPTDTVYLGAFRTADLRAAGGWDERFATNQDFELNRRLGATGVVWFAADLEVGYVPRATVRQLAAQYHRFGRWKVRYWAETGDRPQPRQVALLVAPIAAVLAGAVVVRRIGVVPGAALALLGAVAVEGRGAQGPEAGPLGHAWGVAALVATASGWTTGVWAGALARVRPRSGRPAPASGTAPSGTLPS
jgi:succinoglycan biosynthesis protein ExoA